jgi:hypothetical protein
MFGHVLDRKKAYDIPSDFKEADVWVSDHFGIAIGIKVR